MHSVNDWLAFAIWEGGTLVRSLSLSPGSGIIENVGTPLDFERPYWAGEHPVSTRSLMASAPKPGKPGPGRPPGSRNRHPATRHDVGKTVKRTEPKKKTRSQTG